MRYINVPIKLIAALKPSEFRPFIKKAVLEKKYKNYMNHIFKGHDRIYIPFNPKIRIKTPKKISSFVKEKGYDIVDYKSGLAKNEKGRLIKIGKILKENKELNELFNTSRTHSKNDNLLIVISRHPYDIAGMSTGRGWTSCTNLTDGDLKKYIWKDVENGTLIAYVIDSEDENIEHPICRLLIKQYINIKNENDTILFPMVKVYGMNISGFKSAIIEWLNTFQSFKGVYTFGNDSFKDGSPDFIGLGLKKTDNIELKRQYYISHPQDEDAKKENDLDIRISYYENNPDDEDIKDDRNDNLRYDYYSKHLDDPDAKDDKYYYVRKRYYDNHPNDTDARDDEELEIRKQYYARHPEDDNVKYDPDTDLRFNYYMNHPNDPEAKKDKNSNIRLSYFKTHGNDESFKKDPDPSVRFVYYFHHPEDPSAYDDPDPDIKQLYIDNLKI